MRVARGVTIRVHQARLSVNNNVSLHDAKGGNRLGQCSLWHHHCHRSEELALVGLPDAQTYI